LTKAREKSLVTEAQARKTALVVATVLAAISLWNLYRGRPVMIALFSGAAGALMIIGLALPSLARRFHILWMNVAKALGYVNSRILLGLIFYGIFTPYGFISRLVGRDPLGRRGAGRESYWTERKSSRQTREQFERLF
jgi:hypothetical protein